ncbi:MAG TPA: hypothetical protein VND15_00870 [Candidatus Acidoferrales bacterium]|nr:hypothetical protein [Candidatus Acidoferrales bacterium]
MKKEVSESKSSRLARSPRLDTIFMVEKSVFKYSSDKTVTQIWKLLPKKVMWTTFKTVLDYLEYSGKIIVEEDRTLTWIWNPIKIAELKKKDLVVVQKLMKAKNKRYGKLTEKEILEEVGAYRKDR